MTDETQAAIEAALERARGRRGDAFDAAILGREVSRRGAAIERVRQVHTADQDGFCETCGERQEWGELSYVEWPCPTRRALDDDQTGDQG